jgi:segregation and condensation protein A
MVGVKHTGYQVALPVFAGPLDLLLHLIEREELDITAISLAQVTDQYLAYLAQLSERDPADLASFVVVAAKLLVIKSRALLPRPPAPPAPEEEEADDLLQQLLEYKKVKEAARLLQELEAAGRQSYVRLAPPPRLQAPIDVGDVTLEDLLAAVREVLTLKPPEPLLSQAVRPVTVRLSQQMALIEQETAEGRTVSFRHLLAQAASRIEIIVTLLALLEMIKQLRIQVQQDRLFGDILIAAREPGRHEGEA